MILGDQFVGDGCDVGENWRAFDGVVEIRRARLERARHTRIDRNGAFVLIGELVLKLQNDQADNQEEQINIWAT